MVQPLGEVLHHVVALGLAVHQDVQADVLLQRDDAVDLDAHGGGVGRAGDAAGFVVGAGLADRLRLREGPDRGGGQQREAIGLGRPPDGVGAARRAAAEGVQPGADPAVHLRGGCAGQFRGDGIALAAQRAAQGDHLIDLLPREREPPGELRRQGCLGAQLEGHVKQRAGRADDQLIDQAQQRRAGRQRPGQVGPPHVAAVDDAGDQGLAAQPAEPGEGLGARAEAGLRTHGRGTFRCLLLAVASQAARPSA